MPALKLRIREVRFGSGGRARARAKVKVRGRTRRQRHIWKALCSPSHLVFGVGVRVRF